MQMGAEAGQNMMEANQDLEQQRQQLLKFTYYDEELNIYIEKATGKV